MQIPEKQGKFARGWSLFSESAGEPKPYHIEQGQQHPKLFVHDHSYTPGGCGGSTITTKFSVAEIVTNLHEAIHAPGVQPHYRGGAQERAAYAAYEAFCADPNTQLALGFAEVALSAFVIVGTGGVGTGYVILRGVAWYGVIRRADTMMSAEEEIRTDQPTRQYTNQALDYVTGNEDRTDAILTFLDIGIMVVELGGTRLLFKKVGKARVVAPNRATGQLAEQIAGPGQRLAGQIDTIARMRPFADRLKDVIANPSKWKVVRSVSEASTNMRNRAGRSLQEILRNEETGETIVRHTLFRADGSIFELPHFRDLWK